AKATDGLLPPDRELLQHGHRGRPTVPASRRLRDPAGLRRALTARAIARRVLSRGAQEPVRPEWSLHPRRARGRALPAAPAGAPGANAAPGRRRLPVRHRDALSHSPGLPRGTAPPPRRRTHRARRVPADRALRPDPGLPERSGSVPEAVARRRSERSGGLSSPASDQRAVAGTGPTRPSAGSSRTK